MYTFSKTDTYKIKLEKDGYKVDSKVLIRLYQPIIGAVASSLYYTLHSEASLNKDNYSLTLDRLLKILNISIKDFNNSIEKLAEVKLVSLRANSKKQHDYLFKVNCLKRAIRFFEDKQLNSLFKNNTEEVYAKQVFDYFKDSNIDEDEYVDIDITMTDDDFFLNIINKYEILKDCFTDNVKKEVLRVKKIFNLSFDNIEFAILRSVDNSDSGFSINLITFNDQIEKLYSTKKVDDSSSIDKFANMLDMTNSTKYYEKNINRSLLNSEIKAIIMLKEKNNINDGMLNAIFDYYFHYGKSNNNGQFPQAYIQKIIDSCKENGCNDALSTMNYFINMKKNKEMYKESSNNDSKCDKIKVDNEVDEKLLRLLGD